MSDKQFAESRPVCEFFARRQCKRGRYCRFLHVITLDRPNQQRQDESELRSVSSTETEKLNRRPQESSRRGNQKNDGSRPICKHFLRKGWCGFGRDCAFVHVAPQPRVAATAVVEHQETEDGGELNVVEDVADVKEYVAEVEPEQSSLQEDAPEIDKKKPTSERLCKFYKAGYCRMGRRCNFKHVPYQRRRQFDGRPGRQDAAQDKSGADLPSVNDQEMVPDHASSSTGAVVKAGNAKSAAESGPGDGNRSGVKETTQETLKQMRSIEITQLKKRFPQAKDTSSGDSDSFQFVFLPTDPDWPYDVKEMKLQVTFPPAYPSEKMDVVMLEDERVPELVQRVITVEIQEWISMRFKSMETIGKSDLAFRPFLRWLDRKAEDLFTEALKEFRRKRMAEMAGLEFISAEQLRRKYKVSDEKEPEANEEQEPVESHGEAQDDATCSSASDEEDTLATDKENLSPRGAGLTGDGSEGATARRGTEVSLQNLQLLNCAATLTASQISLMISCERCANKSEMKTKAGQLSKAECPYCHSQQLVRFRETVAHQFSSIIGYLDLEGCDAFDMMLSDCQFVVNCLECSKDNKLEALPPGQLNTTWCFQCHNKLTTAANNVRFAKLSPTAAIDSKRAATVELKGRVKAVKDPAIVEGKPLPANGACRHFKKSFRWFRFPCCGKAYPCDICHDENEMGHEMKRANRIICGFCAKEQICAAEHPCISCQGIMTNRTTAHWEGGTGCRDKIKMSRGDSKKYTDSLKTASRVSQTKKETGTKKTTKLRHVQ